MWCRDLYIRALISKDKKQKQSKHKTKSNQMKNKIKQTIEQGIKNKNNKINDPKTNSTEG